MKQHEVVVGATYEARVSGKLVSVRVLSEVEARTGRTETFPYLHATRGRRQWRVRNISTGREITVTAARLRRLISAVVQ